MVNHLQPQLKNATEIKEILKEVPVNFTLKDGREVSTLLVYLPIDSGKSDHSAFFEIVKKGILHSFVFSCSEIEKKLGVESEKSVEELLEKALRKLSIHTAKGELGELILFTLMDIYFEAPKILSKVSMKTSRRMPVFGADAVHAKFNGEILNVYLGESKLSLYTTI